MAKTSTKTKRPKLDPKFVSLQLWEISYISHKFGVKPKTVRWARAKAGKSRRKVYAMIRTYLQEIKCKTHKG